MKKLFFGISLGLAVLLSLISESTAADCSTTAVSNRLQECASLQLSTLMNQQNVQSSVSKLCESVDCSIGCYTRVYEVCLSTGIFQVIDLKAYKVAARYICNNNQDTLSALQNCGLTSWTCFSDLTNKLGSTVTTYSSSANATAYVSDYCSAAKNFKSCKSSSPLVASGSCTTAQAKVLNNIFDVSLSINRCGISQNNELFDTYRAPLDETTCGADKRGPIYVVIIAITALKWFL